MKLRNKKTGEIIEVCKICPEPFEARDFDCNSLAELNEEWEDYEEPKGTYFINTQGDVQFWDSSCSEYPDDWTKEKEIGNYFETKEETEKAVEKLKAWKRLKDKGFRFDGWKCTGSISFTFDNYYGDGEPKSASDDLDLLFGGEE